jgi:hypothetical protein
MITLMLNVVRLAILMLFIAAMSLASAQEALFAADADNDDLPDDLEQGLLDKFVPTFLLSEKECASMPAEFQPGLRDPKIVALNGTIYGQAFPASLPENPDTVIELHYYHLWSHDCGRGSHALDAEHVSVLIGAGAPNATVSNWKAMYWYAAAHEGTPCDGSNGAKAAAIGAEETGATIWVSRGKHAAFLSHDLCGPGCGTDDCNHMIPMSRGLLINVGEPGKPLNGALWTESKQWRLLEKMGSDFTGEVLVKLNRIDPTKPNRVSGLPPPVKPLILASNSAFTGLDVGARQTGGALQVTVKQTSSALGKTLTHTGHFFKRAYHAVARVFNR